MKKENFAILNVLRGLSALFVIVYHFFVFFFAYPETSAGLFQIEPIALPWPDYLQALGDFPLNLGHFGVGFFFLISGFLIIPSLERYTSLKAFLTHKVFRLWPTYALCFCIGLLFVMAFFQIRNTPFPYSFDHMFACLFWVRDILHYPFIDGSVWSLEIQLKFYLFLGLLWAFGQKNFLEKACCVTILLSVLAYGLFLAFDGQEVEWFYLVTLARKTLCFFVLMLLGTCIYALYEKRIAGKKAFVLGAILLACFLSPLFRTPEFPKIVSYLLALTLFSIFILLKAPTFKPTGIFYKIIKWVSDISYPVYVGHVLPGYALMFLMVEEGFSVYLGIFLAILYTFLMATFVHKKVELFFLKTNKKTMDPKLQNP